MNTLISQPKFFSLHGFRHLDGNLCNFRSHNKIVELERKYSHAKDWQNKFLFVSGVGWEFPTVEVPNREFPLKACWSLVSNKHEFKILLSPREETRIRLVQTWVTNKHIRTNLVLQGVTPRCHLR